MQEGRRPVGVGLFFSLGHSTIVVALTIAIAAATAELQGRFDALAALSARWSRRCSCSPSRSRTSSSSSQCGGRSKPSREAAGSWRTSSTSCSPIAACLGTVPPLLSTDRAKLAHVPARRLVRPRLRHGDRSGTARDLGDAGLARPVNLVDPGLSGFVDRRHDLDRYDR